MFKIPLIISAILLSLGAIGQMSGDLLTQMRSSTANIIARESSLVTASIPSRRVLREQTSEAQSRHRADSDGKEGFWSIALRPSERTQSVTAPSGRTFLYH